MHPVQPRRFLMPETQTAMLFLLPSFLGFMVFMALPILASLALSFTNWHLISTPSFVGLKVGRKKITRKIALPRFRLD
ncbi:hypothetical protein ACC754_44315, partial [Rhizobium johnstonii]